MISVKKNKYRIQSITNQIIEPLEPSSAVWKMNVIFAIYEVSLSIDVMTCAHEGGRGNKAESDRLD